MKGPILKEWKLDTDLSLEMMRFTVHRSKDQGDEWSFNEATGGCLGDLGAWKRTSISEIEKTKRCGGDKLGSRRHWSGDVTTWWPPSLWMRSESSKKCSTYGRDAAEGIGNAKLTCSLVPFFELTCHHV